MTNQELQSRAIDVMRFPLAVMVVAIHTYFCEALKAPGNIDVPFTGVWAHELITFFSIVLTDAAVPAFFVMSGYLFFMNTNPINTDKYDWGGHLQKMERKCLTLLVPYIVWNIVSAIIEPSMWHKPIPELLTGLWIGPWNGPLWFMRELYVMMLFAPIFEWCIKRLKWLFPLLLWIVYASKCLGDNIISGVSFASLAFFAIGEYLGIQQKEFIAPLRKNRMLIIGLYLIMMIARITTMHLWGDINVGTTTVSSFVDMLYIIATIPAWFVIASYIGERTQHLNVWRSLASSSFVVFAMHRLFNSKVSGVGLLLLAKPEISGLEAVALYFATITITVAVCITAYWIFTKNKATEVLFLGARKKNK